LWYVRYTELEEITDYGPFKHHWQAEAWALDRQIEGFKIVEKGEKYKGPY